MVYTIEETPRAGASRTMPSQRATAAASRLLTTFSEGAVISLYEAQVALGKHHGLAGKALAILTADGELDRVAPGLWVRPGVSPNPYRVGARIIFPYAFACETALALLVGSSDRPSEVLIASQEPFRRQFYDGVGYRYSGPLAVDATVRVLPAPWLWPPEVAAPSLTVDGEGGWETVIVTDFARTLIDCARTQTRARNVERIAGSMTTLPELDRDRLETLRMRYSDPGLTIRLNETLQQLGLAA